MLETQLSQGIPYQHLPQAPHLTDVMESCSLCSQSSPGAVTTHTHCWKADLFEWETLGVSSPPCSPKAATRSRRVCSLSICSSLEAQFPNYGIFISTVSWLCPAATKVFSCVWFQPCSFTQAGLICSGWYVLLVCQGAGDWKVSFVPPTVQSTSLTQPRGSDPPSPVPCSRNFRTVESLRLEKSSKNPLRSSSPH